VMMEKQRHTTPKIEGWEDLTDMQKRFICLKKFFGSDEAVVKHIREKAKKVGNGRSKRGQSIGRDRVCGWRKNDPNFINAERRILTDPIAVANALLDDLVGIAAMRQYDALMSDDIRTAQAAANTVFKAKGILSERVEGGSRVVVILHPAFAEREKIGTTDYRFIEGVPASLGPGSGAQVQQEDKSPELGQEVG